MATAGILHSIMASQTQAGKAIATLDGSTSSANGSNNSSSSSSSDSDTISANDFLTLLVTEMQNQDPTADSDPNQYINQLVEVNSLEQLIDINQTLSTDLGTPSSSSSGSSSVSSTAADAASTSPGAAALTQTENARAALHSTKTEQVPGNLSIPGASAASQRVARALEQPSHGKPIAGRLSTIEQTALNNRP